MPYNCTTCDKKFRYKISLRTHKCDGIIIATEQTSMLNNDTAAIVNNHDQKTMSASCLQSMDEHISESCHRMIIVDQTDPNQPDELTTYAATTENDVINSDQSMIHFECDSFNLNDLVFCTGETSNTDLANVMPSMNEIFPQSIMNALYDNVNVINSDIVQHFYGSASTQP